METKLIIEEVENLLDTNDGISPVHSHFYLLASDLHKIQGKHALYYRASLRYLGCTEVASLTKEEQANHAFHLALAALLGDRIFNFGELLAHEVLQSLKGTEHAWLIDLLLARSVCFVHCGFKARNFATSPQLNARRRSISQACSVPFKDWRTSWASSSPKLKIRSPSRAARARWKAWLACSSLERLATSVQPRYLREAL